VRPAEREPALLRLARELFRFVSVILWLAAPLAFVAAWADPGQGMAEVGAAVVAAIVVSGLFSFWQDHRVERMLAALGGLLPTRTRVMRAGREQLLPLERLAPGDVTLLAQATWSGRLPAARGVRGLHRHGGDHRRIAAAGPQRRA
jgi:sodium/potassium-transporting ATPase subunit alpha